MSNQGNPKTNAENPLAADDFAQAIKGLRLDIERGLSVCFPACIYSYNRTTHTAEVMPLVKMGYFYDEWRYKNRGHFSVSVRNIQCGGITIDVPLFVGDTGWVIASDRDTFLLKQYGALTNSVLAQDRPVALIENSYQQQPNQPVIHSFTDGFFIPDNWGIWEPSRYKDNPLTSVGNACYIGSSFDTEDLDVAVADGGQTGDAYQKKTTSSLVVQPSGGVFMASSTNQETGQSSSVEAIGDRARISALDLKENRQTSLSIGATDGINIRQIDEKTKTNYECSVKPGEFLMRMVTGGDHVISIAIENGNLSIGTTDDIMVRTDKSMMVNCKEADVNCTGDVNVSAGGNANVKGDAGVNINSTSNINMATAAAVNMTALKKVNLVTGGDVEIMSKKEGSSINVTTLSKESQISITTEGESSNIDINAQKADVNINAKNTIGLTASDITVTGNLGITGEMRLNDKDFHPSGTTKSWEYS